MAARAFGTEVSFVRIFMAASAVGGEPHPRVVQVFAGQQRAKPGRNMLWGVAGSAAHTNMLSIDRISGFRVIEPRRGWRPVHQSKVDAVVIRMTLHA